MIVEIKGQAKEIPKPIPQLKDSASLGLRMDLQPRRSALLGGGRHGQWKGRFSHEKEHHLSQRASYA